ncbi:hypothetical protein SOVF_014090, partial [Spinacia oleracea]
MMLLHEVLALLMLQY